MKKTIKVEDIKQKINNSLLNTKDDMSSERSSLQFLLEEILTDTGNYNGFRFLTKSDMIESIDGTTIGIGDYNYNETTSSYNWDNTDNTRVFYF